MKTSKKNKFIKCKCNIFLFLFCFFAGTGALKADDTANLGKEIAAKWENVIVTVKIVMKQKIIVQGREVNNSENKMEIGGTVIEDSGLTVVSLSAIEPSSVFDNMAGEMPEGRQFKYESEITDLKIRFTKENEVNAKIVLRDKDMDLAFVRPIT
ncbi:hypothetical protein HY745_06165, partial [Candidatus Desantisbacteria bacterium]|nr:hypothetical protein [Candidatus Desantisbacteria bacterium]